MIIVDNNIKYKYMIVFIEEILPDQSILLKKKYYNLDDYDIINNENGDIIINKKQKIFICNIDDLKSYNFINSKCEYCKINGEIMTPSIKYNNILKNIFNIIDDGTKIIKNSILNIKTTNETEKGFKYLENIGISYQGIDSNKCIKEIFNQCTKNNIKIKMKIILENNKKINIKMWF